LLGEIVINGEEPKDVEVQIVSSSRGRYADNYLPKMPDTLQMWYE
jgi:hypothetical protein